MQHRIRSINLHRYAKVAQELGIDHFEMFRKVGVDHCWLNMPDLLIPEKSYAQLLDLATHQAHGASLGMLMGANWKLSDFGRLSLLLQHQPSLAALFQSLKTYHHLIGTTLSIETVKDGKFSIIQLHLNSAETSPTSHRVEVGITALLCLCRHQLGKQWQPLHTHFSHAAPHSTLKHQKVIGSDIIFSSDFNGIVLSEDDMHYLRPEHDSLMEEHARALINMFAQTPEQPSLEQEVRNMIHTLMPHGRHSIHHVANALGYNVRSLQRKLEKDHTSFQDALDTVRTQAALRALQNPSHSISDAAFQAGFSENSSFTRWFMKRFAQSPSDWRHHHVQHARSGSGAGTDTAAGVFTRPKKPAKRSPHALLDA